MGLWLDSHCNRIVLVGCCSLRDFIVNWKVLNIENKQFILSDDASLIIGIM